MLDFLKGVFEKAVKVSVGRPLEDRFALHDNEVKIPNYDFSYEFIQEFVKHSSTLWVIFNTLGREILKNGFSVVPEYGKKCTRCGKEFYGDVKLEYCDECGGRLVEPNPLNQKKLTKLLKKVNDNGQTLLDLIKEIEWDLDTWDNAAILIRKDYYFSEEGNLISEEVKEIIRVRPDFVKVVINKRGEYGRDDDGNELRFCPLHRDRLVKNEKRCPICGKETFLAKYKVKTPKKSNYYASSEMNLFHKYNPSKTYGYSPLHSILIKAAILMWQDKYIYDWYFKQRPPKQLVIFKSGDLMSLKASWEVLAEKVRENPHALIPLFVQTREPNEEIVEIKELSQKLDEMDWMGARVDIKREIGAVYGVMPLLMGDIEASGGLNNEGLQIAVSNRAVEWGAEVLNTKVLLWLSRALGVHDWRIEIEEVEEKDVETDLSLIQRQLSVISMLRDMGFEVELDEESELARELAEMGIKIKTGRVLRPADIENIPESEQEVSGDIALAKSYDLMKMIRDFAKVYNRDLSDIERVFETHPDKVKELWEVVYGRSFKGVPKEKSDEAKRLIIYYALKPSSWGEVRDRLKELLGIDDRQAEVIARTEMSALQNKLRELYYMDLFKGKGLYRWIGPDDHRTTEICKEIKRRTRRGVRLNTLKKIIKMVAHRYNPHWDTRDFVPHPGCRHTFIRISS